MNAVLVERLDAALPQTQCTRCGYDGCRPYAEAIARGEADINRCPPGGDGDDRGARDDRGPCAKAARCRLRHRTRRWPSRSSTRRAASAARSASTPARSTRSSAPQSACTPSWPSLCSGCELCVAPCPVDCIRMVDAGRAWTTDDASAARGRHRARDAKARARRAHRAPRRRPAADRRREATAARSRRSARSRPHASRRDDSASEMSHDTGLRYLANALVAGMVVMSAAAGARAADFSAKLDSRWDFAQAGSVRSALSRGARPVPGELPRGARDRHAARARARPAAQVRRRARHARSDRARARSRGRARARPLSARARPHVQLDRRTGEGGPAVPPGRRSGRARSARTPTCSTRRRAAHARHRGARVASASTGT